MRTLAIHMGGLGDFILALPALEHLAQDGPLELAGNRERLQLAVISSIAEAAHHADSIDFASVFSNPSARLQQFLARFDRAVVWMRDDGVIASALRHAGISDVRCFPGVPPDNWAGHASEYYAHCVGLASPPLPRLELGVAIPPSNEVVLHPGSGSPRKNWPWEDFLTLSERLRSQGFPVRWCIGPAEEALLIPAGGQRLQSESLEAVAQGLAAACMIIGNDTGIAHLAAALGRPTVAIFGPTEPARWAPRGPQVHVVQGQPWPSVEDVFQVALRKLNP